MAAAPVPAALDKIIRAFVSEQRYTLEKFSLYRNGNLDFQRSLEDIIALRDEGHTDHWDRMTARRPPRANYRGIYTDAERVNLQALADQNQRHFGDPGPPRRLPRLRMRNARREVRRAGQSMNQAFRFVKYLGIGGQGMASLWEYRPGRGQMHLLVLKVSNGSMTGSGSGAPRPDTAELGREKAFMTRLLRAPHILQRFLFKDNLPQSRSRRLAEESQRTAQALDKDSGFLFMKYARFGDLERWVNKAGAAATGGTLHFPVQALWRFFDCLVKGCIALDYPPRTVPANIPIAAPPGTTSAPTAGGNLPETIPPGGLAGNVAGHQGIVHFDLDPTNVFVQDYDQPGPNPLVPPHTDTPRLQIADFGLAETVRELWAPANFPGQTALRRAKRRYDMWATRKVGKDYWYLPEQFSVDWDAVNLDPSRPPPTGLGWAPWAEWPITSGPGRYTHRSNIWHIGMIMHSLMTLERPQFPPVAGRMTRDEPAGMPYGLVPRSQKRWTYGYKLVDPDPANNQTQELQARYGTHLCEVVARCLMNKQEHRPNLQQLQDWITTELTPPPGGGPPPHTSPAAPVPGDWRAALFGNPPAPKAPWQVVQTGIDNSDIDPFWDYRKGRPVAGA